MRKRIYYNYLRLILLCVLLLSSSFSGVFYDVTKKQEMNAIKDRALLISSLLNARMTGSYADKGDDSGYGEPFHVGGGNEKDTARITIIAPDGAILLDSQFGPDRLENHADREEFVQALQSGNGEATRFSRTLGNETYYYAMRLNDGNVLRISKSMNSIAGIFTSTLPAIIIITAGTLLLANFISRRLTAAIVRPLSDIDFESDNVAVYDELSPYVKKIDQQKQRIREQLAALKGRADTIDAITGNMKEGLILINKTGTVLSANKRVQEILGESDMVQRNILQVCRHLDFQQGIKQCFSGANPEIAFELDDTIYNIYFSPVYSGGEINGALILFFDVTERHKAEKQRREFSANVSHELKTPLTTISALSEMIESGMAREEDVKNFSAKISAQAKRLIDMIDDMIKLSEFDENRIQKEYSTFDLYELTESVITVLREKADEKRVSLHIAGERFSTTANRRMIDELLYNLIDNGIKYNNEGGQVTVTLSREDSFCKISVADTGIGIPQKYQSRVFERFYRVDKSRSKKTGGTGLGLSIVKHIVEHHNGRIEIENPENTGTTIACFLKI